MKRYTSGGRIPTYDLRILRRSIGLSRILPIPNEKENSSINVRPAMKGWQILDLIPINPVRADSHTVKVHLIRKGPRRRRMRFIPILHSLKPQPNRLESRQIERQRNRTIRLHPRPHRMLTRNQPTVQNMKMITAHNALLFQIPTSTFPLLAPHPQFRAYAFSSRNRASGRHKSLTAFWASS